MRSDYFCKCIHLRSGLGGTDWEGLVIMNEYEVDLCKDKVLSHLWSQSTSSCRCTNLQNKPPFRLSLRLRNDWKETRFYLLRWQPSSVWSRTTFRYSFCFKIKRTQNLEHVNCVSTSINMDRTPWLFLGLTFRRQLLVFDSSYLLWRGSTT